MVLVLQFRCQDGYHVGVIVGIKLEMQGGWPQLHYIYKNSFLKHY